MAIGGCFIVARMTLDSTNGNSRHFLFYPPTGYRSSITITEIFNEPASVRDSAFKRHVKRGVCLSHAIKISRHHPFEIILQWRQEFCRDVGVLDQKGRLVWRRIVLLRGGCSRGDESVFFCRRA